MTPSLMSRFFLSMFSTSTSPSLLRVKLKRGLIGLPDRFKEHTRALGLRQTHQKTYVAVNARTLGNILKVKELVDVRPVKGKPGPNARYWSRGYEIINE
jgi:ribosomal protein L30/L7E